jgi:molecular chaperone HscB
MDAPSHFVVLGLEPSFDIDVATLERNYLAAQQRHHPDRFAAGSVAERRVAMETSAALNEGYRVLRDPVRRAEYLCKLGGIDLDVSGQGGAPAMPQSFLIEMIERREALAQTRARGPAALDELREKVEHEREQTLDLAASALRLGQLRAAATALVELRYLARLLDEIDGEA